MREIFNNDSPQETPSLPAKLPESEDAARGAHQNVEEDEADQTAQKRSARADWQQTTDIPDEEGDATEEEFVLSPVPLENGQTNTPDNSEKNRPRRRKIFPILSAIL